MRFLLSIILPSASLCTGTDIVPDMGTPFNTDIKEWSTDHSHVWYPFEVTTRAFAEDPRMTGDRVSFTGFNEATPNFYITRHAVPIYAGTVRCNGEPLTDMYVTLPILSSGGHPCIFGVYDSDALFSGSHSRRTEATIVQPATVDADDPHIFETVIRLDWADSSEGTITLLLSIRIHTDRLSAALLDAPVAAGPQVDQKIVPSQQDEHILSSRNDEGEPEPLGVEPLQHVASPLARKQPAEGRLGGSAPTRVESGGSQDRGHARLEAADRRQVGAKQVTPRIKPAAAPTRDMDVETSTDTTKTDQKGKSATAASATGWLALVVYTLARIN